MKNYAEFRGRKVAAAELFVLIMTGQSRMIDEPFKEELSAIPSEAAWTWELRFN